MAYFTMNSAELKHLKKGLLQSANIVKLHDTRMVSQFRRAHIEKRHDFLLSNGWSLNVVTYSDICVHKPETQASKVKKMQT